MAILALLVAPGGAIEGNLEITIVPRTTAQQLLQLEKKHNHFKYQNLTISKLVEIIEYNLICLFKKFTVIWFLKKLQKN